MSMEKNPEFVCHVGCEFCNTALQVSVPLEKMTTTVTVRCGHCSNMLHVNMNLLHVNMNGMLVHASVSYSHHLKDFQLQKQDDDTSAKENDGSSSNGPHQAVHQKPKLPPNRGLGILQLERQRRLEWLMRHLHADGL